MLSICLFQEKFYIWNAEDACRVREEYRIVGSLVGCLPRVPMQNLQFGLPLQLMKEEARFLVEKGFARVYDNTDFPPPSDADRESFTENRKRIYEEQVEACKTNKEEQFERNFPRILEGKKKKRMEKATLLGSAPPDDSDLVAEIEEELRNTQLPELPLEASSVQIHTACFHEKPSRMFHDGWTIPMTGREELEYRIFSHFWEKGYFLTRGGKFGGDFLVYPGDPSRFHSFFIVVCLEHERPLSAMEMIRLGRLGSNVKKTVVLCSIDSSNEVFTVSLEWSKMS